MKTLDKTIAISSGKGGTGKTFVSTNLVLAFDFLGYKTSYIDCDAEEPNGHLFLKPDITDISDITIFTPGKVDKDKCIVCGKCAKVCTYNAIAKIKNSILIFPNLCHGCNACKIACPKDAIVDLKRNIGKIHQGKAGNIDFSYGLLQTGEGGMTPRVIKRAKENITTGINILDSPPGTSCPVVETLIDSDITLLITDPTPFGLNDLKLSVDMCFELGIKPFILINRADDDMDNLLSYCKEQKLEIIGQIPDDKKIAECYSVGDLAFESLTEYQDTFINLANFFLETEISQALPPSNQIKVKSASKTVKNPKENIRFSSVKEEKSERIKEVVIISGKGGTGKTSVCAALCALEGNISIADCDVDAADLHLVLSPEIKETGLFSGGKIAKIDAEKCIQCGECYKVCAFDAIIKDDAPKYEINSFSCEGCNACSLVCKAGAIIKEDAINGSWFISDTRFGSLSHAKLAVASENSGKLVALVKNHANSSKSNCNIVIIDGSPGTGCPVISSLTGADYVVVVTEPTVSGVHDLLRVIDLTDFFRLKTGVIVNKSDLNKAKSEEIKSIAQKRGIDFLGIIPYDKSITQAQKKGISVIELKAPILNDILSKIWTCVKEKLFSA
jgi:MinD superfamily P-loop ATPase